MINAATLDLIKEFEGCRLTAYQDSVGVWTIGYGTTARAKLGIDPQAGMTITQDEAEGYLRKGVQKFASEIRPLITQPINENEFGAFVSLAYNIGSGAFSKSSALRNFNAGNKAAAAESILLWNKAGGQVLRGLVRRREAEKALFLTPVVAQEAPKPIFHPDPQEQAPNALMALLSAIAGILAAIFGGKK